MKTAPTVSVEWQTVRLGEVIDIFDNQRVPLNSRERQERRGQYPYYGAQGVIDHIDGYIFDGRYILVAEDGENLNSKKLPLALSASGKFWVNNHAHILRAKRNVADDNFILACLNNADIRPFVTGAAQPKLSQANLRQIEIPLPPLPVQQRIASMLSAYDELIENNQKRIRILETMARSIYREWFVNFRFPGHEKFKRVASALGEIPEGWEVHQLSDLAVVNREQLNPRSPPDQIKYIDIASVSPGTIDSLTTYDFASAPGRARRIVAHGDILWSCVRPNRRSHALIMHPALNTIASTGFAVITPSAIPFPFLYYSTTTDDFVAYLTNNATGAAYPAVTASTFERAQLIVPSADLLQTFGRATVPMMEAVHVLQQQIANLRQTRDLLLPRLLSGGMPLASVVDSTEAFKTTSSDCLGTIAPADPIALSAPEETPTSAPVAPRKSTPEIDDTDRTDVLCAIRNLFNDDQERERDAAIRELAHALGYQRTGSRVYEILSTDLQTAVRRGIVVNVDGVYRRGFRTLADCTRESLKKDFESAIGRVWISREDAIRALARWLGFARVGAVIDETGRSLINGLIREGRLETDGPVLIRRC